MKWTEQVALERASQKSNIILVETTDILRIPELILELPTHLSRYDRRLSPTEVWTISLQENTGVRAMGNNKESIAEDAWQRLLTDMRSARKEDRKIMAFIYYVHEDQPMGVSSHVPQLTPHLLAWHMDTEKYLNTIVVFTDSLSRFPQLLRELFIAYEAPLPNDEERRAKIMDVAEKVKKGLAQLGVSIEIPPPSEEVVKASAGLNLNEVESCALKSLKLYRKFQLEVFRDEKISLLRARGLEYVEPTRGFETVAGYDPLKEYFRERVVAAIKTPEILASYGLPMPRGLIMYGPPGVGKTWFAKALAAEAGIPMVKWDMSAFLRGIVGESEARVKQVVAQVNALGNIIVFIDEIDQLAIERGAVMATDSGVTRRVTSQLLDWAGSETRQAFLVGATNFAEQLDKAWIRPGRIDEVILVPYPGPKTREEIIRIHTSVVRKMPLSSSFDYTEVVEKTRYWTGAEIEKLCIEAGWRALRAGKKEVDNECFREALSSMRVDTARREEELRRMRKVIEQLGHYNPELLQKMMEETEPGEGFDVRYKF